MSDLVRLSFSLEKELFDRLGTLLEQSHYANRSEFIRDMIRDRLVREQWEANNEEAVGTISLVYDHHTRGLTEKLTELQHHHGNVILAVTHVHLDRHMCVEVILVKGLAASIRELANLLRREKGVLHGTLCLTTTGRDLA